MYLGLCSVTYPQALPLKDFSIHTRRNAQQSDLKSWGPYISFAALISFLQVAHAWH